MMGQVGEPVGSNVFRLPVSGRSVALRAPTGAEDLLLLEAAGEGARLALALAEPLATAGAGEAIDWQELTVADLNALVCRLRQMVLGDRVRADVVCQTTGCRERIDLAFGLNDYLAHHAPRVPGAGGSGNVTPDPEPGWFRLRPARRQPASAEPVRFRLPRVADELAVAALPGAVAALAARCIRPEKIPPRLRQRVEAAMEKLAPDLCSHLEGTCPACGGKVRAYFDPRRFCLKELRDRARFIYEDIDLLARRYHWTEAAILALPQGRRMNYVELARREQ